MIRGDKSACTLSFCSDGVNPFKTMHVVYSMWPLMLPILNLPVALRKSVGGILLVGVIPGNGRKEAFHIDPYIELIVDELLTLSECNIFHKGYMNAPINVKSKLLQFVLDFPGIAKVMQQPGQVATKPCPWCDIKGEYSRKLGKTIYL